jgi:hypothetical protein
VRWTPVWESVGWSYESVVRQPPASKNMNTEDEEAIALKAVPRRQPVKIQQTVKT